MSPDILYSHLEHTER